MAADFSFEAKRIRSQRKIIRRDLFVRFEIIPDGDGIKGEIFIPNSLVPAGEETIEIDVSFPA